MSNGLILLGYSLATPDDHLHCFFANKVDILSFCDLFTNARAPSFPLDDDSVDRKVFAPHKKTDIWNIRITWNPETFEKVLEDGCFIINDLSPNESKSGIP